MNFSFTTVAQIQRATNACDLSKGGKKMFPMLFKKAVAQFMLVHPGTNQAKFSQDTGINPSSLGNWMKQLEAGLYTEKGTFTVSQHSLSSNAKIIKELDNEIMTLQHKKKLVEECIKAGMEVKMPRRVKAVKLK